MIDYLIRIRLSMLLLQHYMSIGVNTRNSLICLFEDYRVIVSSAEYMSDDTMIDYCTIMLQYSRIREYSILLKYSDIVLFG